MTVKQLHRKSRFYVGCALEFVKYGMIQDAIHTYRLALDREKKAYVKTHYGSNKRSLERSYKSIQARIRELISRG